MEQSLAVRESYFLAPAADIAELNERYHVFNQFVKENLRPGVDFMEIPGTDKPSLVKPGAEKLATLFGLSARFIQSDKVEDWSGADHAGEPFFYYVYRCELYRGDRFIASCDGSCNSFEKKYRYRWVGESEIPYGHTKENYKAKDGKASEFAFAVEKAETAGKYGKPAEYWKRFQDAITSGTATAIKRKTSKGSMMDAWEIGSMIYCVPNEDIADQVNTFQKMAQKRAYVGAVLIATNASEYFTQDVEDMPQFNHAPTGETPIEGEWKPEQPAQQQPAPEQSKKAVVARSSRPYDPETVKEKIATTSRTITGDCTPMDRNMLAANLELCFAPSPNAEEMRHGVLKFLCGTAHVKDLFSPDVLALKRWLDMKQDSGGEWYPNPDSAKEARLIWDEHLKVQGQEPLI